MLGCFGCAHVRVSVNTLAILICLSKVNGGVTKVHRMYFPVTLLQWSGLSVTPALAAEVPGVRSRNLPHCCFDVSCPVVAVRGRLGGTYSAFLRLVRGVTQQLQGPISVAGR